MSRISSLDTGYLAGDLSIYPESLDNKDTLYEVKNNAVTKLKQSLNYNGKYIIVEDASAFPEKGLLRIGPGSSGLAELIYYGSRTNQVFKDLIRGFAGSRQNPWMIGDTVTNSVVAESHNAIKDAIINLEKTLGIKNNPADESLNGILTSLENKFLSPKPSFRAFPLSGTPPLSVRFQNFSENNAIKYLWDFGDGSTSTERNPNHVYTSDGIYSIKLNVITSTGGHGISIKSNYITVSAKEITPFFYYQALSTPIYSTETANTLSQDPATILFVDQTDGDISQRFWVFDDGETMVELDPDIHTVEHIYQSPGNYNPSLIILFADQTLKRVFLSDEITVL